MADRLSRENSDNGGEAISSKNRNDSAPVEDVPRTKSKSASRKESKSRSSKRRTDSTLSSILPKAFAGTVRQEDTVLHGSPTSGWSTSFSTTPIPIEALQRVAMKLKRRPCSYVAGVSSESTVAVFYFEATIETSCQDFRLGLAQSPDGLVGDEPDSIAIDFSGKLHVDARPIPSSSQIKVGDTVGLGMEILGMRRIFWTLNGQFLQHSDFPAGPAYIGVAIKGPASLRFNLEGGFKWQSTDRLAILPSTERLVDPNSKSSSSLRSAQDLDSTDLPRLSPTVSKQSAYTQPLFGSRKTKNKSLEDDLSIDDGHVRTSSSFFGSKSNNRSLVDDHPGDDEDKTHSSPSIFGSRKSKIKSLEDDHSDDHGHHKVNSSPPIFGSRKSKSNSLEDDNFDHVEKRKMISTPPLFGTRKSRNVSLEDERLDPKNSTLESKQHHSNDGQLGSPNASTIFGSRKSKSSLEDDHPDVDGILRPMPSRVSFTLPTPQEPETLVFTDGVSLQDSTSSNRVSPHASSLSDVPDPRKEDTDFQAALQQSVQERNDPNLVVLMTQQELEDARSFARELRAFSSQSEADLAIVKNYLVLCQSTQGTVKKALEDAMNYDESQVELEELFVVNEMLLDAIGIAKRQIDVRERKENPSDTMPPSNEGMSMNSIGSSSGFPTKTSRSSSTMSTNLVRRQTTRSLEIDTLVRKKDVFSLICMLRAQSDKRLDSAIALMRFAREAEWEGNQESMRLRNEIRSSGGMHSLLTLFRTKGTTRELKVVAALAVAYLLPSFVESSAMTGPTLALRIVDCLRFLFISLPVSPKSVEITRNEMYNASAIGLTTFWMNAFFPMLQQEGAAQVEQAMDVMQRRPRGRQVGGGSFDQRQETLEVQELLEIVVSLIVSMAKMTYSDIDKEGERVDQSKLSLRYTLVEQMCAVDVARPLAVREGLLKVLVGWMRSKNPDQVRPAATSLRDLTSTLDKYMAGWIHSQIVSEGALGEIVQLVVSAEYGHDVRLAVAQILSSLCVAPHTRAAVVEAKCINYLIPLLWFEHNDTSSQQVAFAAGSALLQLAAGAMTRAAVYQANSEDLNDAASPDKGDQVISDIVNGGAIGPLVLMAKSVKRGKLRSMSIEALRVISEDTNPTRLTRLQLCEDRAAEAMGNVLQDDVAVVARYLSHGHVLLVENFAKVPKDVVNELHQALCTLANMLDPSEYIPGKVAGHQRSRLQNAENTVIQGSIQIAKTGGLQSLLLLCLLPFTIESLSATTDDVDAMDLLIEACRSLAALCPLLLSNMAATDGYSAWTCDMLRVFTVVLNRLSREEEKNKEIEYPDVAFELKNDVLRGLSALARSEPLKIRIIDTSLPYLIQAKAARGDRTDVANSAAQVCLSLGFAEDELAVQVAGNDPKLLGDWFCMQRSLLIQAMAREEIRMLVAQTWKDAIAAARKKGLLQTKLTRESSGHSSISSLGSNHDAVVESGLEEIFENIGKDEGSYKLRASVLRQYEHMYDITDATRVNPESLLSIHYEEVIHESNPPGLLSRHVYPLNDCLQEKEWVLGHQRILKSARSGGELTLRYSEMDRVHKLLNSCIPSTLLQSEILPVFDLRPEASFSFRALVMPQNRYFSFRREGQLVQRLCDKQAAELDSEDVHWTIGFTNSSFAGEFSETLVQALYRCPMIRGLSFTRDMNGKQLRDHDIDGEEGSGLLANLAGSLPPWVADLTYDNVLNDRAVKALVAILETMGKLSAGQQKVDSSRASFNQGQGAGRKQGSFRFLGLRNSPHLDIDAWYALFDLLGRSKRIGSSPSLRPLASLRCLDLSGNDLSDEACSMVLEIVHSKESRCCLEQLDLSRNSIRQGIFVIKAVRNYIELHRYNQRDGVKMTKRSWMSPLHTLNLSYNQLYEGGLPLELIALLKNNALNLKTLDLSFNDLDFKGYQFTEIMCGSLAKNTSIRELNLSGNNLASQTISDIVDLLHKSESESGLTFLRLDGNVPPLSAEQLSAVDAFHTRCRSIALERLISDKERIKNGEAWDDSQHTLPKWGDEDTESVVEDDLSRAESFQYPQLKPPQRVTT